MMTHQEHLSRLFDFKRIYRAFQRIQNQNNNKIIFIYFKRMNKG